MGGILEEKWTKIILDFTQRTLQTLKPIEVFSSDKIIFLAKGCIIVSLRIGVVNDVVLKDLKVGVTLFKVLVVEAFSAFQSSA